LRAIPLNAFSGFYILQQAAFPGKTAAAQAFAPAALLMIGLNRGLPEPLNTFSAYNLCMANISNNLMIGLMLIMAAGLASANENFTYVNGYVFGPGNATIAGAAVTAVCLNNSNSFNKISGPDGYYLGGFECPMNGTVQVNATKGNATGTATGIVTYFNTTQLGGGVTLDIGIAYVDVQIPEFPTAAAPVLLSMLSFGLLRLRKR